MKKSIKNHVLLPVLFACVSLLLAGRVTAQTYTDIYSFSSFDSVGSSVNSDGALPNGDIVSSSNTLYGTTSYGGSSGVGTVFAVNTDGTGFSSLYSFGGGSDGKYPRGAGLVLSGTTLYGTTSGGGNGIGNLFAINTDGSGFTDLYDFSIQSFNAYAFETNSDGSAPNYLVLSGSTLYGTAAEGGIFGKGTVFAINTDGSGFTTLHNFGPAGVVDPPYDKNTEGASPSSGVIISDNTLYGTALEGGSSGYGTVFKVNTDGTVFTVLHSFTAPKGSTGSYGTNSDGAYPARLIVSGKTLYGTTTGGGSGGYGTVFRVNTDGTGFTILYSGSALYETFSLVLSGKTLYWMSGDVFAINTDGTGFTTLPTGNTASQTVSLILSGNNLYGAAAQAGTAGNGSVFSFLIPPQLTLTPTGPNVVLTWPTNATGFTLQSTTNLSSSAVWTTNLPSPIIVNDQNAVTNPVTGTQQFFRLSR